jgi:hypothetical protein
VLKRLRQAPTFEVFWDWALAHSPALSVVPVPLSQALLLLPRLIQSQLMAEGRALAA